MHVHHVYAVCMYSTHMQMCQYSASINMHVCVLCMAVYTVQAGVCIGSPSVGGWSSIPLPTKQLRSSRHTFEGSDRRPTLYQSCTAAEHPLNVWQAEIRLMMCITRFNHTRTRTHTRARAHTHTHTHTHGGSTSWNRGWDMVSLVARSYPPSCYYCTTLQ